MPLLQAQIVRWCPKLDKYQVWSLFWLVSPSVHWPRCSWCSDNDTNSAKVYEITILKPDNWSWSNLLWILVNVEKFFQRLGRCLCLWQGLARLSNNQIIGNDLIIAATWWPFYENHLLRLCNISTFSGFFICHLLFNCRCVIIQILILW